ncbi:MAG: hypothetical protein HKO71_03905 [Pseudomonadales bacterium]|nr:hypothetical protein [Pseudomonadales bacterium]
MKNMLWWVVLDESKYPMGYFNPTGFGFASLLKACAFGDWKAPLPSALSPLRGALASECVQKIAGAIFCRTALRRTKSCAIGQIKKPP